ncbi:maleylpyruvate isomerase family mycothiol-dependent enzyme [Actinokineospora guangxiensis]|uniref:Maleylpyruvate isomerase family mycothiol-dependent enzyme n=1 Tax=Actinokineospora guangxiensis TaxID=1490288 RepID=A0ABW0ET39_9PSEU
MADETIMGWTAAARLAAAELAEGLDARPGDGVWAHASLCDGWTVLDVLAHMTLSTRTGWRELLPAIVRARGDFDRMEAEQARARARAFTPAELIAQLRETASSPRRSPGSGALDPLVDGLVHAQDMARPLGLAVAMPTDAATAALGHVLGSRFYGARKRFRGVRLVAQDAEFAAGEGAELRGPVAELLMVATGRPAGLAALSGAGLGRVAAAMGGTAIP